MSVRIVAGAWVHEIPSSPDYVFELLTTRRSEWLTLHPREGLPDVVSALAPSKIVWSSFWPVSPSDTIEIDLHAGADGLHSTTLHYRWLTDSPPDERGIAITRQRLNKRFGADIRGWTGRYETDLAEDEWRLRRGLPPEG